MADTNRLREAIDSFAFHSRPSNGCGSDPCTNQDLNNAISKLAELLHVFADELE